MKKYLTVLLVMAFVVTAFAGLTFAHGPQAKGSGQAQARYNSADRDFGLGYRSIELSEEQITEIADLREEFYTDTEELRDQLRDLNREIRDLEFRGASNAEIGEVEDQLEEVRAQMDEKRTANQEKIESVLTEEQLALMEENRLNYEERYQMRFNNQISPQFGPMGGRGSFSPRGGYSRFDDDFYGMMGRNFNQNRSGRAYGFGPGWCH